MSKKDKTVIGCELCSVKDYSKTIEILNYYKSIFIHKIKVCDNCYEKLSEYKETERKFTLNCLRMWVWG